MPFVAREQLLVHTNNSDINAINYRDKSIQTIRGHNRAISGVHEI